MATPSPRIMATPSPSELSSETQVGKNMPFLAMDQSTSFMAVPETHQVHKPIKSDTRQNFIAKGTGAVKWNETPSQHELRVYLAAIIPDVVHEAINNSMRMHHETMMTSLALAQKVRRTTSRKSATNSVRYGTVHDFKEELPVRNSRPSSSFFHKTSIKRKLGSDLYSSRKSLAEMEKFRRRSQFEQKNSRSILSVTRSATSEIFEAQTDCSQTCNIVGPVFAFISLVAICVNSILVGIEANASVREKSSVEWIANLMIFLNIYFVIEVTVKMLWFRTKFFTDKDERNWNIVDSILGIQCFVDLFFAHLAISAQSLRLMRLVRLLRSFRLLRWVHQLREFRKMVYSMVVSAPTLMWACILLFFVIYCFAVFFSTAVQSLGEDQDLDADIHEYFGTTSFAMLSLWLSITSGMNWVHMIGPLHEREPFLAAVFVAYIALTVLGVMNIVTSVFVESAMTSTKHFRDLMQQETYRDRAICAKHLKDIFTSIDADSSGQISMQELKKFLADPTLDLQDYLEALQLNAEDAKALFKLLDRDNSGEIDIDEFCDGCLRLKGEAKSFDLNCVLYEGKRTQAKLDEILFCFDALLHRHSGDFSEHANRRSFGCAGDSPRHSDEQDKTGC